MRRKEERSKEGRSKKGQTNKTMAVTFLTALGVLCCFALFVCLTLLASFFLPSHLSFKNMYIHLHVHVVHLNIVHVCIQLFAAKGVVVQ